jgi:hypothetical protein
MTTRVIIEFTLFCLMLTALVWVTIAHSIPKQQRIDDLYNWRCCLADGSPYRNIDLQGKQK